MGIPQVKISEGKAPQICVQQKRWRILDIFSHLSLCSATVYHILMPLLEHNVLVNITTMIYGI